MREAERGPKDLERTLGKKKKQSLGKVKGCRVPQDKDWLCFALFGISTRHKCLGSVIRLMYTQDASDRKESIISC